MRCVLGGLLVCVGLALAPASAPAKDPPYIGWNPLLPSLAQPYHPSRARDCVNGDPGCIETTLTQMYRRFDRTYATCDHNSAFGITYIRVTEAIRRAILAGVYEEPRFLAHEDRVFARMYFGAYDDWKAGRRERVPPAWREAFDTGRARSQTGLGNLLMSMNAHINRDMPFMLDALGLTMPSGRSRKPDHDRGNVVLNRLYDDVLKELAARYDPAVDDVDVPGVLADDAAVFQTLQGWREGVWRNAELLGAAKTKEQRRAVADYIEQYALNQARTIRDFTRSSSSKARDAHCAAYRRTHHETGGQAVVRRPPRGARVRHGRVRLRVRCPEIMRQCAGSLALLRGKRTLARRRLPAIAGGRSRVVTVKLGRRTRRVVRRRGQLVVRARASSPSPWGTVRRATTRVRLRR
jgi:uncharacterized protein DUF5995